jgi:GT2 family glycosyltransferase
MAVPRATWEALGGFADYFMYHEDVEWSLRARLAGGRLGIEPTAVVDHDYSFAKGQAKWRHLERNRWATILRTYPGPLLALLAPALAATEAALALVAARGGWGRSKAAAGSDTLRTLPGLLRSRRAVQRGRTITSADFARWLTPDLESEYLGRVASHGPLRVALRAYWAAVCAALRIGARTE